VDQTNPSIDISNADISETIDDIDIEVSHQLSEQQEAYILTLVRNHTQARWGMQSGNWWMIC